MRWYSVGMVVEAEGFGRVTIEQAAQFDTLVQIRLSNGETAWTDASLIHPTA